MSLSIIIVSFNSLKYLKKCLSSTYQTAPRISFEVIVIDNGSRDSSQKLLRELKSKNEKLKIIFNKKNLGFAKANNQGIKLAQGKYLLLLNPDTEVLPKSIEQLIDFMEKEPDVGMVGPRLLNPDRSLQISAYYNPPNLLNCFYEIILFDRFMEFFFPKIYYPAKFMLNKEECQKAQEVSALLGAAILFRRSLMEKIGLLDERFSLYREETDFCKRAKEAGFKIYYFPEPCFIHAFGGTTSNAGFQKTSRVLRSRYLFHRKHYGRFSAFTLKLIDFLAAIPSLIILFLIYGFLSIFNLLPFKRKKMLLDLIYFRMNLIRFWLQKLKLLED